MAEWKSATYGSVPDGAFSAGYDGGPIFVCRAWHEGELIPGKLVPTHGVAYVSFGGQEHKKDAYEVLCGTDIKWIVMQNYNADSDLPPHKFEGGKTAGGERLFIGRVHHNGVDACGKVCIFYFT